MIIPLGGPLQTPSSDLTRRLPTGRGTNASLFDLAPRRVWLFSLQQLPEASRSRSPAHSPGHSLCSTVPYVTVEGRYPLRYPLESGLSSPRGTSDGFNTLRPSSGDHPQNRTFSNTLGHKL